MGRTKTTRPKGNGAGHGGAANGAGLGWGHGGEAQPPRPPFGEENRPNPNAQSAGRAVAAQLRAMIAARRSAILEAQIERALDPAHPQGHAAAKSLLDMICPPETRQTLVGDSGAPITRIERVIISEPRPE